MSFSSFIVSTARVIYTSQGAIPVLWILGCKLVTYRTRDMSILCHKSPVDWLLLVEADKQTP